MLFLCVSDTTPFTMSCWGWCCTVNSAVLLCQNLDFCGFTGSFANGSVLCCAGKAYASCERSSGKRWSWKGSLLTKKVPWAGSVQVPWAVPLIRRVQLLVVLSRTVFVQAVGGLALRRLDSVLTLWLGFRYVEQLRSARNNKTSALRTLHKLFAVENSAKMRETSMNFEQGRHLASSRSWVAFPRCAWIARCNVLFQASSVDTAMPLVVWDLNLTAQSTRLKRQKSSTAPRRVMLGIMLSTTQYWNDLEDRYESWKWLGNKESIRIDSYA